jgi:hypothetical protein
MPSRAPRGPDVDQRHGERRRLQDRDALTCWVGWWACQDLNLGPHPYQLNAGNRCANRPFPRSRPTVGAKGLRSISTMVCVLLWPPDTSCHRRILIGGAGGDRPLGHIALGTGLAQRLQREPGLAHPRLTGHDHSGHRRVVMSCAIRASSASRPLKGHAEMAALVIGRAPTW